MKQWEDTWPTMRLESHFGDRVVRCFAERPATLYALLANAADAYPSSTALVCGEERITWQELLSLTTRFAAGLAQRGVVAGDRVAMLIGNRTEFVTTLFAAAHLGAIAVPLSTREQTPGLAYMLNDCTAAALVHDADLKDRLPTGADVPALCLRVSIGASEGSEEFAAILSDVEASAPATVQEEDVAAIMYTSGTTGNPK
ncbi:MAG: AMP-binding protein, partial [Burkholderiaceae bacterium]